LYCFGNETTVETREEGKGKGESVKKWIGAVKSGEWVLGENKWTTVWKNYESLGEFEFVRVSAGGRTIEVTPDHGMVVLAEEGEGKGEGKGEVVVQAGELEVGDVMVLAEGKGAKVTEVRRVKRGSKFSLATRSGVVAASGFRASTICSETFASGTSLEAARENWVKLHHNFTE
jgi:hypothetical protein